VRASGRSVISDGEQQQLRDLHQPYNVNFAAEKARLSQNNGLKCEVFPEKGFVWSDPNRFHATPF
jgi:hypothetical protein